MKDIDMTHDSNLTISSRPAFLSVLAALNASVISFFVLWSMADAAAVNRAEEHGRSGGGGRAGRAPHDRATARAGWG